MSDIALEGAAGVVAGGDVTTITGVESAKVAEMLQTMIEYQFKDDQRREVRQEKQDRERMQDRRDHATQFSTMRHYIEKLGERVDHMDAISQRTNRTIRRVLHIVVALVCVVVLLMCALIAEYAGVSDAAAALLVAGSTATIYYVSHR